jgi:tetratricopeptide (TPR) repeat protein
LLSRRHRFPFHHHHHDHHSYYYPYWRTGFFFGVSLGFPIYDDYVTVVAPSYPVYSTYYYDPPVIERRIYIRDEPEVEQVYTDRVGNDDHTVRTKDGYIYRPPPEESSTKILGQTDRDSAEMVEVSAQPPEEADEQMLRHLAERFSDRLIAGQEAFRAGNYGQARSRFAAALAIMPDNLEARLSYAQSSFAEGDYTLASAAVRVVAEIWPEVAESKIDLYQAYDERREALDAQIETLTKHVINEPDDLDGRVLLGYQLFFSGSREAGLEQFRKAEKLEPSDPLVTLFLNSKE